ncbi:MAG: LpxL/LpxP family Kdo(2)-lipid IV(A) lauroyl/palmitoleoyl acyltransferase [Gammaproteobacteria bacterium]
MKAIPEHTSRARFLAPRFWPTWLGMSLARLLQLLPYRLQLPAGPMMGRLFMLLNPYRRLIVNTNLALCFPELDDRERQQLYRRVVRSLGLSLVEEASSIWAPDTFFDHMGTVQGLEHIAAAQAQGKGVLLLSGHFCSVDFAGRVLLRHHPVCFTYQELRNPLSNHILTAARKKFAHCIIHRHDIRGFIKTLKAGEVVWYAPDQSQARKNSVFAPFFGIQANTLTATTKLVKMTGAVVLPFEIRRRPDAMGYALTIQAPLEDFPGNNEEADAARFNALLEAQVRENPDQYLWIHRRFKARPVGEPRLYPKKPRRAKRAKREQRKAQQ